MPLLLDYDNGYDWDGLDTYDNPVQIYTNLITSEHADKTNYIAWVAALCQPFVDEQELMVSMPGLYDLDVAVGSQLDTVGLWVGISRDLQIPLTGVYFSFDTTGLGFDEGTWFGPFDSTTALTVLPDDSYRKLIHAKIANNEWDGTIPTAYDFLNPILGADNLVIQDNTDMTMLVGVIGNVALDAVTTALLENGYLDVKPVGVRITAYVSPSVPGDPFFGFDVENSTVSGFDVGAFALLTGGR
jgi:hypothetical protein